MKHELLTSYLNISKLLELVPNSLEYIAHRKMMSQNEIEVANIAGGLEINLGDLVNEIGNILNFNLVDSIR
jgi:hypothetical protein